MATKKFLFLLQAATLLGICSSYAQQVIDLSGSWHFGLGETPVYNDSVKLPGSMLTNDKGDMVTVNTVWTGSTYDSSYYFNPYMDKYRHEGNIKFPFFLTPRKHYVGRAWYQRSVKVPKEWKIKRITLFLERPHIETTVYVNGKKVGHNMSLSVPHIYDVTQFIKAGKENLIGVCVYNGIENVGVGQDSHSVTDQTQGNWNGIAGRIELRSTPQHRIQVLSDVSQRKVNIAIDEEQYQLLLGDTIRYWSEFDPYLYTHTINHHGDSVAVTFGIRNIEIRGRQFYLNGNPIWLRGAVENCLFPETGYPPTDEASWIRLLRKCKEYGLNHVRFHSYCPPEAAFAAADRVGIYLQPEGPSWPNHGVKLRKGQIIDEYLLEESKRIVDTYGHHPSFVMMAAGNEPAGDWVAYCNDWVKNMHDYDPTKVYCGASVGGGWAWDNGSEYHVKGGARGLDWDQKAPHTDDDYYSQILFPRNYKDNRENTSPIIAHEQGQWCAFPNFREIADYTGVYKARNFEIFKDLLSSNGMENMADKFLSASGQLQMLCYKYEIERNLRTNDYAGFQLLGLNDYSGQGTALVGVLDVHWNEKPYTKLTSWRESCSPMVALARFPKFVYLSSDTLNLPVSLYNAQDESEAALSYVITEDGTDRVVFSDSLGIKPLPVGKHSDLFTIRHPLTKVAAPSKLKLKLKKDGSTWNSYDFWVYPDKVQTTESADVYITDTFDAKSLQVLHNGGKVLITASGKVTLGNDVVQHYLPVFWNTSWFKMRPPHTTGAYIDKTHPLFNYGFPTDDWSNLNWWELLNKAKVMNLMELPADYQPPIQPIDTWHVSRKLGMLFEANVLNGKLLMTTMDITSDLDQRVVARQMRHAILGYMQSNDFNPSLKLAPNIIADFFTRTAPKVDMFTKESPDELKPALK